LAAPPQPAKTPLSWITDESCRIRASIARQRANSRKARQRDLNAMGSPNVYVRAMPTSWRAADLIIEDSRKVSVAHLSFLD
jgi:hypothetical protein